MSRLVLAGVAIAAVASAGLLAAGAGATTSAVRTVSTKNTDVARAGTFRVRVTRLSAHRLRVTMVLRVRGRKTSTIWMGAAACKRSQIGGNFCAESTTEDARSATLRRGRRRIQRTVVVRYPGKARARCAQADVIAGRADGSVVPLLRDNPNGRGRGPVLCPD